MNSRETREQLLWKSWGSRLRLARDGRFTQTQLADLLGVTQSTVSKWEHGELCPEDRLKMRLSEILDRPLDDLFRWPMFLPPEHEVAA